jgi:hypothetical protein
MTMRPRCVSFAVAVMAIILFGALPLYAQGLLGFGFLPTPPSDQSIDFNSFLRGDWIRNLGLGRTTVGILYGGGSLRVTHTIEAGPNNAAAIPGIPDFDYFSHTRDTPLRDGYVALELALASQGFEFIQFRCQTNLRSRTQFTQWTDPGLQSPGGWVRRYAVGSVLALPINEEGIIYLDNRNRIWSVDLTGRIPGFWGVDFLFEYKWSQTKSDLDPYSKSFAPLERTVLDPNVGWVNNWRNSIPFSTSFNMSQNFTWNGPFFGLGLRTPFPGWLGAGYLEFVGSPWVFGRYKFGWGAEYTDGFFFVRGSQLTNVAGWDRIGLEARGGISCPLFGRLSLDLSGKYMFIRLRDSNIEYQTMQNNFLANQGYVQGAPEYVTATQQFWQIGGDVNLPF